MSFILEQHHFLWESELCAHLANCAHSCAYGLCVRTVRTDVRTAVRTIVRTATDPVVQLKGGHFTQSAHFSEKVRSLCQLHDVPTSVNENRPP